jgi:hypothetical protein
MLNESCRIGTAHPLRVRVGKPGCRIGGSVDNSIRGGNAIRDLEGYGSLFLGLAKHVVRRPCASAVVVVKKSLPNRDISPAPTPWRTGGRRGTGTVANGHVEAEVSGSHVDLGK